MGNRLRGPGSSNFLKGDGLHCGGHVILNEVGGGQSRQDGYSRARGYLHVREHYFEVGMS